MRLFSPIRILAALAASALLPSISAAQADVTQMTWYGDTPWLAEDGSPGSLLRAVAGDFNRDGARDVFVLAGGNLAYFYAPAAWDALNFSGGWNINDIAALPGPNGVGQELVFVDENGLQRRPWGTSDFGTPTVLAGTGTDWAPTGGSQTGATRLRTGDLDGDGHVDCFGIKEGQHSVLVRDAATGTTTSFSFPWLVHDVQLVQWDGGTAKEIAVLDDYGVEVFTAGGSRINRYVRQAGSAATDAITVFRKTGYDYDRIVWARTRPSPNNTQQELVELAWTLPLQAYVSTGIYFNAGDFVSAMVATDAHHVDSAPDGNYELMVQHKDSHDAIIYRGVPAGPLEDAASVKSFKSTESGDYQLLSDTEVLDSYYLNAELIPGYTSMPSPLWEDLSGDGVPDVFLPIRDYTSPDPFAPTGAYFQFWRGVRYFSALPPPPDPVTWPPPGPVTRLQIYEAYVPIGGGANEVLSPGYSEPDVSASLITGQLHLTLNLPPMAGANRLEIVVWRRAAGFVAMGHQYDQALYRLMFRLPTGWVENGTEALSVTIPMNFILDGSGPAYQSCQTDENDEEKEFWLGIHLSNYDISANPHTLRQVGEQWIIVLAATEENGEALYIPDFSDALRGVCNFPNCSTGTLPCTEQYPPPSGTLTAGHTNRRRFAPTEQRLRPAPPAIWIDVL